MTPHRAAMGEPRPATTAAALVVVLLATALYVAALGRLARLGQPTTVDPAENVHRDPCFWLNTYSNREATRVTVEDDSSGAVLTPVLPSDFAADSAKDAICARRREVAARSREALARGFGAP